MVGSQRSLASDTIIEQGGPQLRRADEKGWCCAVSAVLRRTKTGTFRRRLSLVCRIVRRPAASREPKSLSGVQAVRINGPIAYIILYTALYAAFGVASPFWPKFFETRALISQQIGLILAAAMLMRLFAGPLVGVLADRLGSLRLVLAICAASAAVTAAALFWATTFSLLLWVALAQAAASTMSSSIRATRPTILFMRPHSEKASFAPLITVRLGRIFSLLLRPHRRTGQNLL